MKLVIRKVSKWEKFLVGIYLVCALTCVLITPDDYKNTMLFYMIVLSSSLICVGFSSVIVNHKNAKILFWFGIFIFGSVMAFRNGTGIDDIQYKTMFFNANGRTLFQYFSSSDIEKGFLTLNYLLYKITNGNYEVYQAVVAYISFIFWGKAIWDNDLENRKLMPIMLLFLWTQYYFLIMGAALVRIFMAIGIVFQAIKELTLENYKKYIFYILMASLIHLSALIMLIFIVFIINKDYFLKHWLVFILICSVITPVIFLFISKYFVAFLDSSRYDIYSTISTLKIDLGTITLVPVFIIGLIFYRKIPKNMINQYIISMILIGLSITFEVFASMVSIGRVVFYSNLGLLMGIAIIQNAKKKDVFELIILTSLILYAFVYMMHVSIFNPKHFEYLFPYVSFWGTI